MIKAITFDFGGTLVTGKLDASTYRKRLLNYIHSLGYDVSGASLNKIISGALVKLRKKREKNIELKLEELYSYVLINIGIPAKEEILEHINELYFQSFSSEIIHGVKEVIETLSRKYKLALISNASSNLPRYELKRIGLEKFFDFIIVSRDIGIRKPDPRIFKYTIEKLGIKPEEAIHVGDSIEHDIIGAKRVGMKTAWIKGDEKLIENPDYIIKSLKELFKIKLN